MTSQAGFHKDALEALQALSREGIDPSILESLRGEIAALRGEVAGKLVKAESLKAAATAAEARERGHANRAEMALELAKRTEGSEEVDSFEQIGRAFAGVVPEGDDESLEGLHSMPNGLAPGRESGASARSLKRR
jgi:hypothetical protein